MNRSTYRRLLRSAPDLLGRIRRKELLFDAGVGKQGMATLYFLHTHPFAVSWYEHSLDRAWFIGQLSNTCRGTIALNDIQGGDGYYTAHIQTVVVLATRNPDKAKQIGPIFSKLFSVQLRTLDETDGSEEVLEDGQTLEENATKKARHTWEQLKGWVVAEDTGFFIDALNGRPGVLAKRWAGEGKTTEEILSFTMDAMAHVPEEKRTARFETVAILRDPTGTEYLFKGEVRGTMLTDPRVPCRPNMPYSSIFVPNGQTKVLAEMTTEEENALSHRGQAFQKVVEFLMKFLP